jgi:hypothetical protein
VLFAGVPAFVTPPVVPIWSFALHLAAMPAKEPNTTSRHTYQWMAAVLLISLLLILFIWWYFSARIAAIDHQLH